MEKDKALAELLATNSQLSQELDSPLAKEVDSLFHFIDNFDRLNVLLLKMKLTYLQQGGGIFSVNPEEVEDLAFLVHFLERCQAIKSGN